MAKCSNCNTIVASDAKVCPNCGKRKPAAADNLMWIGIFGLVVAILIGASGG